ncbi:MAG: S49 family peptidase [Nitrospinae bacterium]|nr:S49 family peptidase [Nitrospinota bacterium]
MKLIDIINGPWAITAEMLNEIRSIYAKHLRGEKINIKDIEARTGKELLNKPQGYDLINGNAIIPIEGVIAKKMNLLTQISGGASTQLVERDFKAALNDPAVEKIILNIDSPGGTIDGTFELANLIYESRGKKPIIAYTDGSMLSAAYAIGSAADKIFISGDTTTVGSIGVVAAHEDISKLKEKLGIKTTEIYAGKYKRIASQYQPLSAEGFASIKERVDYLYGVFVNEVAKFRGVSAEEVIQKMSTDAASLFMGKQAIEAGLVDGVSTLDQLINNKGIISSPKQAAGAAALIGKEDLIMDKNELKEKHPDIYKAVYEEGRLSGIEDGKKTYQEAIDNARKEGAVAEVSRIKAVKGQLISGHETLIESLAFDGKTTGPEAAVAVLDAEKKLRLKAIEGFKADGSIKVPVTEPGDGSDVNTMKRKDFNILSTDKQSAFVKGGGKVVD